MAEMLPKYWSNTKTEKQDQKRAPLRRTRQVTEIFTCMDSVLHIVHQRTGRSFQRMRPRDDGIPGNHHKGEPGLLWSSLGEG